MNRRLLFAAGWWLCCSVVGWAEVRTETVEYRDGETTLRGFLAYDDAVTGPRPGVLVVHEWWGLNDYARSRAKQLAELGYVAFAADIYGEGRSTTHPQDAMAWSSEVRKSVDGWRTRAEASLDVLRKHPRVDPQRLAAIGYCFGGATVMQLAYAGADLKAVASFHGSLPLPESGDLERCKASVLACHGQADSFISPEQVTKFQQQLSDGGVDLVFVTYGKAKHSFTNPDAAKAGVDGLAYNAEADHRSWAHLREFLEERFR
jgi:dienelactone hydrolase